MRQQYDIALIFSVAQNKLSDQINSQNHEEVMTDLKRLNIPFKSVKGSYKNIIESSFVVFGTTAVELGLSLARMYKQESVLFLNQDRDAILLDCKSNESTPLGKFKPVPEFIAKQSVGWTFDYVTKQFYICE